MLNTTVRVKKCPSYYVGQFMAMGCSCEVLLDTRESTQAHHLVQLAAQEAWRVEKKFSRYRTDNMIFQLNSSPQEPIYIDDETAQLLDFAQTCYKLSDGLFDVTSGILRRIWTFDGQKLTDQPHRVKDLLDLIGWKKVHWNRPYFWMPEGMEIDLGGIAKEYAVDRTRTILSLATQIGFLINFGGDIVVGGERKNREPWTIGIEHWNKSRTATRVVKVKNGALATSGDSKRFLWLNGKRYGHICNPISGWPVEDAPHSVTVAAKSCTEAGFLSTLAILNGKNAENILKKEGVTYWCTR